MRHVAALVLLLSVAGGVTRAEVAARAVGDRADSILMYITDGVDPIPQVRWQTYNVFADTNTVLNPSGDVRPDGRPDLAWDPDNARPVVVWAYNNGTDHDIALSEWNGSGWTPPLFLTSSPLDEVDPRVYVESGGAIHVVWWIAGSGGPHVRLASRPAGGLFWSQDTQISPVGEFGRRPSVAVFQGSVIIAYESGLGTVGNTTVEVRHQNDLDGSFVLDHTVIAAQNGEVDPVLHVGGGRLWLDWKHSATQFGSVVFRNGSWGSVQTRPWPDSSWVGVESVRRLIWADVLQAEPVPDEQPTDPGP